MPSAVPSEPGKRLKLSIVIICWNDLKVLPDCLRSITSGTNNLEYEIIISDNGSTDGSVEFVHKNYPAARVVENNANLGYARGNNAGIRVATGEYVLILNPDTIVHEGSLEKWLRFADQHPEAGAFGCMVQNPDGSDQGPARPFPSLWGDFLAAVYLRPLGHISSLFDSDAYAGWTGKKEREIGWQSGCCVMLRGDLLKQLGGFDEQFFYHYEEVDLCRRVWDAGFRIRYTPEVSITHLGGQSVGRFPIRFALETHRGRYRYFYKHFGESGARQARRIQLLHLGLRKFGYALRRLFAGNSKPLDARLEMYRVVLDWTKRIDPVRFVETGKEPEVPAAVLTQRA